jgi:hypothetical protein
MVADCTSSVAQKIAEHSVGDTLRTNLFINDTLAFNASLKAFLFSMSPEGNPVLTSRLGQA